MKKRFYLYALAALTLTACSESDEMGQNVNISAFEDTTPVPVQLKAGNAISAFTKAALNTYPGDFFDDIDNMGIYGLAYDKMKVNTTPADVNWFSTAEQSETCCLIDNWPAFANGGTADPSKKGEITFLNGEIKFYPATNFYCYDFYGYYPFAQEVAEEPTESKPVLKKDITNNTVTAQYVIDGTQDLVWGRAHLDDEIVYADGDGRHVNAYSAPWFRAKRKQPGYVSDADLYPSIPLKHLLTRLTFYVIPASNVDGGTDYSEAHKVVLQKLYVRDAKTNIDVLVASQNKDNITLDEAKAISGEDWSSLDEFYNSEEQLLSRITPRDNTTADFELRDVDGGELDPRQVPLYYNNNPYDPEYRWGESIMLYPEEEYQLKVVLSYDGNPENTSEVPLTIRPNLVNPTDHGGKFGIGHNYRVVLKVSGPENVVTTCTLQAWEDDEITQPIIM